MRTEQHNDTLVTIFGTPDSRTVEQLVRCATYGDAPYAVLCADSHVGYSQPIGGAIAYPDKVSPSGVGYDIGCGNKAVLTNLLVDEIDLSAVMDEIVNRISFGMGRKNQDPVDHPVLAQIEQADFVPQRQLAKLAREQLGTVGGGNHYVDLFADEADRLWVGVHFGSRGFGHKTASGFLSLAQGGTFHARPKGDSMDAPPVLFDVDSELGQDYVAVMQLAGAYAQAGRDVVVEEVLNILGAVAVETVHNHHNYAWQEEHFGETFWVVRKGCTPAFPFQQGFVGSSMGGASVILEGQGAATAKQALYSTVHGAGRVMSRTQAAGKFKWRKVKGKRVREQVRAGEVDWQHVQQRIKQKGIELRGGGADEAPEAYKDLGAVLAAHDDTIAVLQTLQPIGVAMAGADEVDWYKD